MDKTLLDIELMVPNDPEKPTRAEHPTDTLLAHEQKNGRFRLQSFRLKCKTESTESTKMRLNVFLDETQLSVSPLSINFNGETHYEFNFQNVEIETVNSPGSLAVRASDGAEKTFSVKFKTVPFVAIEKPEKPEKAKKKVSA